MSKTLLVSPILACCCLADLLEEAEHTPIPTPPLLSVAKPLAMNYGTATITANCLDETQTLPDLPLCVSLCLSSRFRIIVFLTAPRFRTDAGKQMTFIKIFKR